MTRQANAGGRKAAGNQYAWLAPPLAVPERARPLGAESVRRARQLGDDLLLGISLGVHASAADVAASGPLFAEAFACTERSGDFAVEQTLHNNAGWAAFERGDIPEAKAHMEAAIRGAEAIGNTHPGESLNLGMILRAEHDLDGARSMLQEALRIGRRIGDKRNMALAILGLACMAGDLGNWHRAAVLHGAAQALLNQTRVPRDSRLAVPPGLSPTREVPDRTLPTSSRPGCFASHRRR